MTVVATRQRGGPRDDPPFLDALCRARGPRRPRTARDSCQRASLPQRASRHRVREDRGDRPRRGRPRLLRALARGAPFPARGLRVPPQHPHGQRAARPRDEAPAPRVRLQHHAHVASAPSRRGLRRRRHPHRGRVIFGVGRGYHTREVETLGGFLLDSEANRSLFDEQVEIILRAFPEESFSHRGKHYVLHPAVPYRGYELQEITLVPRPLHQPVECWQPIVSASPRGLDFMAEHGIKGIIGGGAATMAEGPITGYRDAFARAGRDLALGENLCLGLYFHLADSRERALREMTPWFEEHVKMFAPLGFVPGITEGQIRAAATRDGWAGAGVPALEDFTRSGAWFCGPPEGLVASLKDLEQRYPGLEYVNVSSSMGTPTAVCLEQLARFAKEVLPHFPGHTG